MSPDMGSMPPEMAMDVAPPPMPTEIPPGLLTEAGGPIQGPGAQPGASGALPGSIQSLPPEIIQALLGGQ